MTLAFAFLGAGAYQQLFRNKAGLDSLPRESDTFHFLQRLGQELNEGRARQGLLWVSQSCSPVLSGGQAQMRARSLQLNACDSSGMHG